MESLQLCRGVGGDSRRRFRDRKFLAFSRWSGKFCGSGGGVAPSLPNERPSSSSRWDGGVRESLLLFLQPSGVPAGGAARRRGTPLLHDGVIFVGRRIISQIRRLATSLSSSRYVIWTGHFKGGTGLG